MLATDDYGYGTMRVGSLLDSSRRQERTHVVAYRLAFGDPPPDKPCILHRCDNPPCCNPAHLWAGTKADNVADMIAKGRALRGTSHGELNGQAKLTQEAVREIRRLAPQVSQAELGRRFGVSHNAVGFILRRESWRHI
jgi:hypothetical protein